MNRLRNFNANPLKIPMPLLTEMETGLLKFI
jgi:hypothetical protein